MRQHVRLLGVIGACLALWGAGTWAAKAAKPPPPPPPAKPKPPRRTPPPRPPARASAQHHQQRTGSSRPGQHHARTTASRNAHQHNTNIHTANNHTANQRHSARYNPVYNTPYPVNGTTLVTSPKKGHATGRPVYVPPNQTEVAYRKNKNGTTTAIFSSNPNPFANPFLYSNRRNGFYGPHWGGTTVVSTPRGSVSASVERRHGTDFVSVGGPRLALHHDHWGYWHRAGVVLPGGVVLYPPRYLVPGVRGPLEVVGPGGTVVAGGVVPPTVVNTGAPFVNASVPSWWNWPALVPGRYLSLSLGEPAGADFVPPAAGGRQVALAQGEEAAAGEEKVAAGESMDEEEGAETAAAGEEPAEEEQPEAPEK